MTVEPDQTATPRIGIQLPTTDGFGTGTADLRVSARSAEQAGFDSVWVGDHFSFNVPVIESVVAATVAAAVTDTIRIGFGVLLPAMRHPGWLAKQLSSLQAVSGDRVILGVGVGGEFPDEWAAVGVPIEERAARTDAFLRAAPSLLGGQPTVLGPPWDAVVPPLLPNGSLPELWVGGRSDAALRRAVRNGAGWLGVWMDEPEIRRRRERLRVLAEESGTATPPVGCSVMLHVDEHEDRAHREMADYMEAIYRLPYDRLRPFTIAGNEDVAVARLCALVDAGVENIVLLPAAREPETVIEPLAAIARRVKTIVSAQRTRTVEPALPGRRHD